MKKILIFVFGLFLTLTPLSASACGVGSTTKNGESLDCVETAEAEEAKEQSRFDAGTKLTTSGEVKKSSFFAGNEIIDDTKINGLAFMAGNELISNGEYEYGFLAGNRIEINGKYERDLFAAGNNLTIADDAKVGRDVFVAGNIITVKAEIPGDIFIAANKIILDGAAIEGDLNVAANSVEFRGDVKINGTFKHNDDIKKIGEIKGVNEETYTIPKIRLDPVYSTLFGIASKLVAMIVLVLVCKKFLAALIEKINSDTSSDVTRTVLIGVGSLLLVPISMIVLLITIVGVPVAIAVGAAYAVMLYFSSVVTAIYVNEKWLKIKNGVVGAALGVVIISLASSIPYLGALIGLIATTFGFGYTIRVLFWKK
ncbi:hypothetical protein IKH83_01955 [Candidatus Saccharibacteria bacterium]|nr:hypothetical protein [Candidatus Saccharibacteria bacterium]